MECAQKLTDMIKQIIEFAKMVPGFMKFSQDDQIVLLKAGNVVYNQLFNQINARSNFSISFFIFIFIGSFELCCLRMSRYYDMTTKHVVFGDNLMPMDAFLSQGLSICQIVNTLFIYSIFTDIADITESKLVTQAFGFAEHIADLKLTEAELALFSAFVLISPG